MANLNMNGLDKILNVLRSVLAGVVPHESNQLVISSNRSNIAVPFLDRPQSLVLGLKPIRAYTQIKVIIKPENESVRIMA